jgi:hypothetical protein
VPAPIADGEVLAVAVSDGEGDGSVRAEGVERSPEKK